MTMTMTSHDLALLRMDAKRKFRAAVYAVTLMLNAASSPNSNGSNNNTEDQQPPRVVGGKFRPSRSSSSSSSSSSSGSATLLSAGELVRKFRAAVKAIMALQKLEQSCSHRADKADSSTSNSSAASESPLSTAALVRKFRAAVHAIMAAQKLEQFPSLRRTNSSASRAARVRKFKASVQVIMAVQKLGLLADPMYSYQYTYQDPVFEWEDTTVPAVPATVPEMMASGTAAPLPRAPPVLTRPQVSLTVDDVFANETDYQRIVEEKRQKQVEEHPKRMSLQDTTAALVAILPWSRALDENMHPRNKISTLHYASKLQPMVTKVIQSQDEERKRLVRTKIKSVVYVIMSLQLLAARAEKAAKEQKRLKRSQANQVRRAWVGTRISTRHGAFARNKTF